MTHATFYMTPLAPIAIVLGPVLLCLIVPVFAMAALGVLLVAALVLLLALAGAVVSAPFLIVRAVRRRLQQREPATAPERRLEQHVVRDGSSDALLSRAG